MWNLHGRELPEGAFSLDTYQYSNLYLFNSTYFNFLHQGVILDCFMSEADCLFLSIPKHNLCIGYGILIGPKLQKCSDFRQFLKFQLRLFDNSSIDLVSGSELTFSQNCRTLALKYLWFLSLHWLYFFHQDLHWQHFSLKNGFLFQNQLFYAQIIISAPPRRKRLQCDCACCSYFKAKM